MSIAKRKKIASTPAALSKAFLFFFLIGSLCLLLYSENGQAAGEAGGALLKLSVRVFEAGKSLTDLKKEHFKLLVNGSRREIISLEKKEKSIGRKSTLGRNFILSFSVPNYTKEAEKGISFFVTEMLRPEDALILLTPLKTYQLKVSANREGMIRHVGDLLKTDCYLYNEKRIVQEKTLLSHIQGLMKAFRMAWGLLPFSRILKFLDSFPRDFVKFKEDFLLPDVEKFRDATELLEQREGERWWIEFREYGIRNLLLNLQEIFSRINASSENRIYNAGQRMAIKLKYNHAGKRLLSNGEFSLQRIANMLVDANMSCSVVFLGGIEGSDASLTHSIPAGLARESEKISLRSGGTAVKKGKAEQALMKIKNHVDHYYELVFDFDGRVEEKDVRVELQRPGKETVLVYKNKYSKEELEDMLHYLARGKVKIVDFTRDEGVISFSIKSYRLRQGGEKGETFGLLKVAVELLNRRGERVYSRQNTLRASRKSLDIKLPLLVKEAGEFELFIKVYDLIANSAVVFTRRIALQ